jgi:dihydroxy-acid dehydratase
MKYLLKQGLYGAFNSDWKTLAENLAIVPDLNDGQEVIHEIQKH